MTTSIIIPSFQSAATLPLVLRALEPQIRGTDREALLVESSGLDFAADVQAAFPWVRVVGSAERLLPGRARNIGMKQSKGNLLAFLDADAVPDPDWLDELEGALRPGADAVAGAIMNGTPTDAWGTIGYLLEFLEWRPERRSPIKHAASCNLLVRRDALASVGGFAEDLWPGEDTVLSFGLALAERLDFAPKARVTHLNRTGARRVLAHQVRLGRSWAGVCSRAPVPGAALAVRPLVPLAVLGRIYSLPRQLRRYPAGFAFAVRNAHRLLIALLVWGWGVLQAAPKTRRRRTLVSA